ncbi:GGDEF domain-containing protein [Dactylosporangium darangshiense]|uniref:GGDEF domain-containing protein n=1 Tax=Dactylosporangium darangshiense TaxID=579108 RepID=A0ABP8DN02_9ACTN
MSLSLTMIATAVVAFAGGGLTAWPTIHRLRARLAEATWRLLHDPLTRQFNRDGLQAAHAAIAQTGDPQPIIAVLIDLDDFKPINDTYGHDAGDDLLIEIGDRINDTATLYGGVAARLSGDEYAALLPARQHDFVRIADTFGTLISQPVELTIDGNPVTITPTASVGLALAETTDALEDVALHRADIAMYHAKHNGRNRHAIYEPGMTMPTSQPRRGPRLRDRRQHDGEATA